MDKVDFKKTLAAYYHPRNTDEWAPVDVPSLQFLMVDGAGDPNTSKAFADAIEALYSVSYTLKFMSKREQDKDYVVPALEGLWYADDMKVFEAADKDAYKWTLMIMQPDWIDAAMVERALAQAAAKKQLPALGNIYFDTYTEGLSLQLLHIGSFDDEAPKLRTLHHDYMPAHGYTFAGHHHEIYLSDMRKVEPAKLRTILRQPVRSI